MKLLIRLATIIPLLLTTAVTAQETDPAGNSENRGIDIETLVERLASEIDREFIIDPRAARVRGTTTGDEIDYESLLGLLRVNDLVAIETADQILIIPEANARSMPSPLLQEDDSRVSDHTIVTRVIAIPQFPQRNRPAESEQPGAPNPFAPNSAAQLVPVLRPMMPQSAMLGAIAGTNQLVIVDRYDNVRRITGIIDEILEGLADLERSIRARR
ncbi:MAG: hypothetical protein PVH89_08965 [Gammaproteobacteria bacterium]|jgi:general secretion pathway protein D